MKLFRTLSLVIFSLACLAASVSAQQPACTVTAESAPEVRGLRLGTSLEQIKRRFPGARFSEDRFGLVHSYPDRSVLQSGENAAAFEGVTGLDLFFVDGTLRKFQLEYTNPIQWNNVQQFAARVSEALKLPAAWKGGKSGGLEMECADFVVGVYTNIIIFSQPGAFDVVERRRKEQQERDRQNFKP